MLLFSVFPQTACGKAQRGASQTLLPENFAIGPEHLAVCSSNNQQIDAERTP
jgi:hypothetical protein